MKPAKPTPAIAEDPNKALCEKAATQHEADAKTLKDREAKRQAAHAAQVAESAGKPKAS